MRKNISKMASLQIARDKRLVKQLLDGDKAAFQSFVDEFLSKLYRHARFRLKVEEDVEDVVQIVCANAARNLASYRGEATLLTWLKTICNNEMNKHLGKEAKRREIAVNSFGVDYLDVLIESIEASSDSDPEEMAQREDLIGIICCAMDELPENYATALELKYIDGLGSKDIANKLSMSDEAAQSLLARARKAFKEVCRQEAYSALKIVCSSKEHIPLGAAT